MEIVVEDWRLKFSVENHTPADPFVFPISADDCSVRPGKLNACLEGSTRIRIVYLALISNSLSLIC